MLHVLPFSVICILQNLLVDLSPSISSRIQYFWNNYRSWNTINLFYGRCYLHLLLCQLSLQPIWELTAKKLRKNKFLKTPPFPSNYLSLFSLPLNTFHNKTMHQRYFHYLLSQSFKQLYDKLWLIPSKSTQQLILIHSPQLLLDSFREFQ